MYFERGVNEACAYKPSLKLLDRLDLRQQGQFLVRLRSLTEHLLQRCQMPLDERLNEERIEMITVRQKHSPNDSAVVQQFIISVDFYHNIVQSLSDQHLFQISCFWLPYATFSLQLIHGHRGLSIVSVGSEHEVLKQFLCSRLGLMHRRWILHVGSKRTRERHRIPSKTTERTSNLPESLPIHPRIFSYRSQPRNLTIHYRLLGFIFHRSLFFEPVVFSRIEFQSSFFFLFLIFFILFNYFLRQTSWLSSGLGQFIKLIDLYIGVFMNFFEEFGDFQLFIFFKNIKMLGFEVQVDTWIGREPLFTEADIDAASCIAQDQRTLALSFCAHPAFLSINYLKNKTKSIFNFSIFLTKSNSKQWQFEKVGHKLSFEVKNKGQ